MGRRMGWPSAKPIGLRSRELMGFASLNPSYELFFFISRFQTAIIQHLSFARPACAALPFLPSARPAEGADGAPIRRIQRSRLRGASDHAYEACIAPIPNRCARLSALRLAVSVTGAALRWPALSPGNSSGRSAPGRNPGDRTPAPPPATAFHRGSQRTPSSLRLQESPLERAPSMSEDGYAYMSVSLRSQHSYSDTYVKCFLTQYVGESRFPAPGYFNSGRPGRARQRESRDPCPASSR